MSRHAYTFMLVLFAIVMLAACVPEATPTTPTPTQSRIPYPSSIPIPTSLPYPAPPTPVSTTTLKPTRTPEPTTTPASTPDFYMTATAIVKAVVAAGQPKVYASYLSPDERWRAEVILYDCAQVFEVDANAYEQLKIIRVNDGMERVVADQLRFCGGLGAYGLGGLFWSPNSRYFYFTDAREGVPDGSYCYWERPLNRVDVKSGSVIPFSPGPLSPDKTMMAIWQKDDVVLWSLDSGEIARVPVAIPNAAIGTIAWSPVGQALIYLQTASDCYPFGKSYIVRLDIPNLKSVLLLESETPAFRNILWDAPNRLRLFDEQGKEWRYNLVTQELKPVP